MRRGVLAVATAVIVGHVTASTAVAARSPDARLGVARGAVRQDTLWSQALGIRKHVVVWLPPSYDREPSRRYPVAYYLHGLYGAESDWIRLGRLDATLDSLTAAGMAEMIVVMPDGDDGWYTTWNFLGDYAACRRSPPSAQNENPDTYCVPWPHYDDYVARDVVAFVDREYRTIADRQHRGIAGLSMGGFGAISLALGYPDVFSAAASHSGVLSPRYLGPRPHRADTARYAANAVELQAAWRDVWRYVGPAFGRDTLAWVARDPARLAARLMGRADASFPAMMIDCGTDDALIDQSRDFRNVLRRLGVEPAYAEWPGAHDWNYWRRHSVESARWLAEHIAR
jgi:S-formylglutathione hydrolase FrmB